MNKKSPNLKLNAEFCSSFTSNKNRFSLPSKKKDSHVEHVTMHVYSLKNKKGPSWSSLFSPLCKTRTLWKYKQKIWVQHRKNHAKEGATLPWLSFRYSPTLVIRSFGVDGVISGSPSKRGLMMALGEAKFLARERDCRDLLFLSFLYLFISSSKFLVWKQWKRMG